MNPLLSLRTLTLLSLSILLSSLLEFLSVSSLSWATTFIPRPFEEYVQRAPQVIRGTTGKIHSDWSNDSQGTRRIYTFTELKVVEVLKGNARDFPEGDTVNLREIGGQKDGVGLMIAGTAEFKEGEDVVVFLSSQQNADGSFDLSNMMMSKLDVISASSSGGTEMLAGPALEMQSHSHPETHSNPNEPGKTDKTWNLEQLRNLIRKQGGSSDQAVGKKPSELLNSPQVGELPQIQKSDETLKDHKEEKAAALSAPLEGPQSEGKSLLVGLGLFFIGIFALAYRWVKK